MRVCMPLASNFLRLTPNNFFRDVDSCGVEQRPRPCAKENGRVDVEEIIFNSTMIRALSFVLAFAALAAAQNDPENQTPQLSQTVDTVTMQLVGNSGQIKLFPTSDSNRFIRIRMSTLTEVDASGSPVPGPRNSINFASLAQGNRCGNGAGWSSLQRQTSTAGTVFYTSTFTCKCQAAIR